MNLKHDVSYTLNCEKNNWQVRRLEAWLSMRMVDDRISNPHGEHAEHLWLVEEPLSESSGSPMSNET